MGDSYRVSVDIGGTFTDVISMREKDGYIQVIKVSSTPEDPSKAFLRGIEELEKRLNIHPNEISCLIHGSTVGCNAVVQGKLPKTALVTTEGFRDVLEIARMLRPSSYDLHFSKARLLVPRSLRFEAKERLDARGNVVTPLTQEELDRITETVRESGAEAVAVSCLFSFLNPTHEQAIGDALRQGIPGIKVCLSSEVNPIFREYERTCVTVLNAALIPVMSEYLDKIQKGLEEMGCHAPLYIMRQDGGCMGSAVSQKMPVQALVSGPTGGALMANYIGKLSGNKNVISVDVGGTTADVCMTTDSEIQIADHLEVGGYPLSVRSIEVNPVGAGGGSIAWVDNGGFLHVGPESAGSYPGPAAYGLGGNSATLTDANLVLGRLDSHSLLNGDMELKTDLAYEAVHRVAERVNMTTLEAAEGIIRIAVANMAKGMRVISVERGFDLREFTLVPLGGGGAMYVSELARELNIPKAVIPQHPGVGSAFGLLTSDLRHTMSQSCVSMITEDSCKAICSLSEKLTDDVLKLIEEEGQSSANVQLSASGDFRYCGQSYEIPVDMPLPLTSESLFKAVEDYHRIYEKRYGHCNPGVAVEIVNLHIAVAAKIGAAKLENISEGNGTEKAIIGKRDVIFGGNSYETSIYQREKLGAGDTIVGPAIISEYDTTIILWPGDHALVDEFGSLVIDYTQS